MTESTTWNSQRLSDEEDCLKSSLAEGKPTASRHFPGPCCTIWAICSSSCSCLGSALQQERAVEGHQRHNSHPHIPQATGSPQLQLHAFSPWLNPLVLNHSLSNTRLLLNANCLLMKTNHHAIKL